MNKSKLFEKLLNDCNATETGGDGGSVDKLVAKLLYWMDDYFIKRFGTDIDATLEEILELRKVRATFDKFSVDYAAAADKILQYDNDDEDAEAISELQFINIMTLLDISQSEDDNPVTLKDFLDKALEYSTEAIREYVIGDEVIADDEENDDEDGDGDAYDELKNLLDDSADIPEGFEEVTPEQLAALNAENEDSEEEDDDDDAFEGVNIDEQTAHSLEEIRKQLEEKRRRLSEIVQGSGGRSDTGVQEQAAPNIAKIAQKAKSVHEYLSSTVYGQDVAVNTFVSGYFQAELTALTDKTRFRPRATFLFAGPPGVGKTFLSEQVAAALKLPFMRFDMSEYSDKEANIEFCGSDKVYKNAKEGNVTGFVAKNPNAILLFDEVEKAHLNVIHLFLQILDAGRLRDNYTDEEVSFKDTIVILTTNAGKSMYEDEKVNLSTVSRKSVLKALSGDINPVTNAPSFPAAICSRFAYGNVVMFNRMGANYLLKIAEKELKRQVDGIKDGTGIEITCDPLLPYAIIYAEGGVADARTVKGKSGAYIFGELYELFRLMQSEKNGYDISEIKSVKFTVELPDDEKIVSLFKDVRKPDVLVFAGRTKSEAVLSAVTGITPHYAETLEEAEEILQHNEISIILCDVTFGADETGLGVLNVEDVKSAGREFLYYAAERISTPVYVLQGADGDISDEEFTSLAAIGATGIVTLSDENVKSVEEQVLSACAVAYQQRNLIALARANKVLSHKTLQRVSADGADVEIALFDFKLANALDAGDTGGVLDGISKPSVKFADVIGAADAKEELQYFINYLKNASKFIKRGVRTPKGILLYGPPGTGKTLLAKAMAGESDVTFIRAEGNQFLKKYVGEGAESVHKLFATARKYAPSILFIDEIDAIAKGRGDANNHSDDVLTSFLTEMDGFNTDNDRPVFVLAATNYDIEQGTGRSLDSALLRRFDRKIYVDLPNKEERIEFLKLKLDKVAENKVTGEQIENIAVRSTGSSLADLDSVFELALRNVIKSDELTLNDKILEEAFETFNSGDVKKWQKSELLRTARHEAGHALICYLNGETPTYLTIVARGNHGGYMQHADAEGKGTFTKKELLARVSTALGGRAAEVVYYGEEDGVSTGASGDLRTATAIIENMICSYGMDESVGLGSVDLSKISAMPHYTQIVGRINQLLAQQFDKVKQQIEGNRAAIDALVEALLDKNALKSAEIEKILKKRVKN